MTKRLAALVVAALLLAACGEAAANVASLENADGVEDPQSSQEEVDTEVALLAYAQCMRDNGVDVPDPTVDSEGNVQLPRPAGADIDRNAVGAAREACSQHLEGLSLGFGGGGDQTEIADQLLAFAECLRDQGLDVDDPDFSEGGARGRGILGGLDQNDPEVAAALEACGDLFTFGGGRGGNE